MIKRFKEIIENYNLIEKNDTIIIGSSGGPDSQFLTYMLNEIKVEYNLNLILAHLNHLHRKEASKDENLVKETAKKLDIKFQIKRASMDEYARANKISSEDAGRRLRYAFFNEIAQKYPGAKIAIAHNKNDQAETMIMRMIRGTGIDGLCAMAYKSSNIIRPILSIEKREIINYLDQNSISYAYDKTNGENDYTRNYIRNEVIPKMENVNPQAVDNLYNLSELLKNDLYIIESRVDEAYDYAIKSVNNYNISFDKNRFESLDDSLKSRVLRRAILKLKGDLKDFSKENIDQFLNVISLDNGKESVKDNLTFIKNYRTYDLYINQSINLGKTSELLSIDNILNFNGLIFKATLDDKINKNDKYTAYFDCDKIKFPLTIRYRQNGDKFKPYGMNNNKKLKDFFIDEKVDRNLRDKIPLIISNDEIIWIVGHRVSNDFKVDKTTSNILKIEVKNDKWY